MNRLALAVCTKAAPLLDLVRGTATNLELEFRQIEPVEAARSLSAYTPLIAVFGTPVISESLLASVHALSATCTWVVLVIQNLSEDDRIKAMEAGTLVCLSMNEAMGALPFLVRSILRCTEYKPDPKSNELRILGSTVLRTPEYVLDDGDNQFCLPPIQGKLLECLALHSSQLLSGPELKQAGWGLSNGVTDHALHQHIRHLRQSLAVFGLEGNLRCLRGKGYVLR